MISAVEALRQPSAQLTSEEKTRAETLLAKIEVAVRAGMEYRGIEIITEEIDGNVIAHVNQRLKQSGYMPTWMLMSEAHPLNKAIIKQRFKLILAPTDRAYLATAETKRMLEGLEGGFDEKIS